MCMLGNPNNCQSIVTTEQASKSRISESTCYKITGQGYLLAVYNSFTCCYSLWRRQFQLVQCKWFQFVQCSCTGDKSCILVINSSINQGRVECLIYALPASCRQAGHSHAPHLPLHPHLCEAGCHLQQEWRLIGRASGYGKHLEEPIGEDSSRHGACWKNSQGGLFITIHMMGIPDMRE